MTLIDSAKTLRDAVAQLSFGPPVTHVYNPLAYAWPTHLSYLSRFGRGPKEVLLVGMNPGPWGMVQTGVPFGEVKVVKQWMRLTIDIVPPTDVHRLRPILGALCPRAEVSGQRLWGWARHHFVTPESFFARFFVYNYCPLAFMEASGKNRTPDKLSPTERQQLFLPCDRALRQIIQRTRARFVVGVGAFARARLGQALGVHKSATTTFKAGAQQITVGQILHPSPASPLANAGWDQRITEQLATLGVDVRPPQGTCSQLLGA